MESAQFLEIRNPNGEQWTYRMGRDQDQVTIGRVGSESNDIGLGPNACECISRRHCLLLKQDAKWWLHRKGRYFPLLRRKMGQHGGDEEVHEKTKLADGDLILILGETSRKANLYWEIRFRDRETTQPVRTTSTFLRYEKEQQALYLVGKGGEQRIHLSDQEQVLVAFLLRQPGIPCRFEDLIAAVWGQSKPSRNQSETPTVDNLRHLIQRLRSRIEPSEKKPCFLISHPGWGYSLRTHPTE